MRHTGNSLAQDEFRNYVLYFGVEVSSTSQRYYAIRTYINICTIHVARFCTLETRHLYVIISFFLLTYDSGSSIGLRVRVCVSNHQVPSHLFGIKHVLSCTWHACPLIFDSTAHKPYLFFSLAGPSLRSPSLLKYVNRFSFTIYITDTTKLLYISRKPK